jgi:putative membrane protein
MKQIFFIYLVLCGILVACDTKGKENIEKADSINIAHHDSATDKKELTIAEDGAAFLVRAADAGMAEKEIASYAKQRALNKPVKQYAGMLEHEHSLLNDQVRNLAERNRFTLPDSLSAAERDEINDLKKPGNDFDKAFIRLMIKDHEKDIALFEKAMINVKDTTIRTFAEKTIPMLRVHLDSAKMIQMKL